MWESAFRYCARLGQAIAAGKHVYTGKHVYAGKPVAETVDGAVRLARAARAAVLVPGVVQDKLFLPGIIKLRRLTDDGFFWRVLSVRLELGYWVFGRVLSVRLELGYWVFEGYGVASQRPSWNYRTDWNHRTDWNYRTERGGGIVLDVFPHRQYLLEDLFGPVQALYARHAAHVPVRWDEEGAQYDVTADDAAHAVLEFDRGAVAAVNSSWAVRVNRRQWQPRAMSGGLCGPRRRPPAGAARH